MGSVAKEAPQQHKQPSRKGKKAWRKNVDVTDVQEGLEIVREEIIKGGVLAEKPSEELFTVDTTGDQEVQKTYRKSTKILKVDQILAQRSAVPGVDSRKRHGVTDGVIEPSSKKRKINGVSHAEYERLKQRAYGGEAVTKDVIKTDRIVEHDPWANATEEQDPRFSFLPKKKQVKAPKTVKEASISLLASGKVMPAVVKPKGALSYNPMYEDWDATLEAEGAKEVEAEKRRMEKAKAEEERLARIAAAQDEREDLLTEDESAWEGIESEYEGAEWTKKKRPERKTPVERNKVKRKQAAMREAKHHAAMKKRGEQYKRIEELAQELQIKDAHQILTKIIDESSDEDVDDRLLRRRRLGKHLLPEKDLELVLPDELKDSLRLLKPEGNLLKDRFRNLLVRGKMETRKTLPMQKKAKRKATEKWTYKDFTLSA